MKTVSYLRVSTKRQGQDGLGIEAQRNSVRQFLQRTPDAEFVEVESGKASDRPQLHAALAMCRKRKARLVIARLDRLARNASFVLNLRDSGVDFVCCDTPSANKLTITILAAVAEQERDWISERTKAALQAAKARGQRLGNPKMRSVQKLAVAANRRKRQAFAAQLRPVLEEIRQAGVVTLKGIAKALNARGIATPLGKSWTRQAVAKLQKFLKI